MVTAAATCPARRSSSTSTTNGDRQTVGLGDVNDYLREVTGEDFTAKDFRTWAGTIPRWRPEVPTDARPSERRSRRSESDRPVAERLNNTRAVCRKCYIDPRVLETYQAGTMLEALGNGNGTAAAAKAALSAQERAVVRLLRKAT